MTLNQAGVDIVTLIGVTMYNLFRLFVIRRKRQDERVRTLRYITTQKEVERPARKDHKEYPSKKIRNRVFYTR